MTYFIENPFQNRTRTGTDLLGAVSLFLDDDVPVREVREEVIRSLERAPEWNRKAWGMQVLNASAQTVEVRALMSANDADANWKLRCRVREELLTFLQTRYPHCLPRLRIELGLAPNPGRTDGDNPNDG